MFGDRNPAGVGATSPTAIVKTGHWPTLEFFSAFDSERMIRGRARIGVMMSHSARVVLTESFDLLRQGCRTHKRQCQSRIQMELCLLG